MKTKKALKLILSVILLTLMWAGGSVRGDNGVGSSTSATKKPVQLGYIPPAWSLKLPASKRFELVLDGEAVLDKETGLVWEKSPGTFQTYWGAAISHAYSKTVGGRKGWRLPTFEELASLVDPTQINPSLPSGHPFINISTVQSNFYWSATTSNADASSALGVSFYYGGLSGGIKDSGNNYVWCVRGGHGFDGQ